jgi:hypothetical protein
MHRENRLRHLATGVFLAVIWTAGCVGTTRPVATPTVTSVTVTCAPASVQVNKTSQCSASVLGTENFSTAVTWSVNGVAGGNSTVGTITSSGLYTAPSAVPSPATVVVKATSVADQTKSGTANIAITPPPPTITSVAVACAPASVQVNKTSQCSASVRGTGSFSTAVAWSVNGIAGGNSAVGTIASRGLYTAPSAVPFPATVVVTGTSTADQTKSGTANVTITQAPGTPITLGGGKLTYVMDSSVPPAAVTYIQKLLADMADSSAGDVYGQCGSAAAATTITVKYDPTLPAFHTSVDPSTGKPITEINALPNPGPDGIDKNFDHPFIHQFGLGLRVRTWAPPFASPPQYGFVTSAPLPDEEGFAETCSAFELRKLSDSGRRKSEDVNQDFQATLLVDSYSPFDPSMSLGVYTDPGVYAIPFLDTGAAVYRLLLGPQGLANLAAYEIPYFAGLTNNQGPLSPTDRQTLFNSLAVIDGLGAGDWLAAHAAYLLGPITPTAGTRLVAWVDVPHVPNSIVVQAASVAVAADGTATYTPLTSGPVTINVADLSGTPVATFTTDLSQSATPGKVTLGLQNSLPVGAYNLSISATSAGQSYSTSAPVIVVPPAFDGSLALNQPPAPLVYAIAVDGSGNATNATLTVIEGTQVYPTSGTATGFVIVQPASTGEVIVNSRAFSSPTTGSRVVFVPPGL